MKEYRELESKLEVALQDNNTYKNEAHRLSDRVKQISESFRNLE